MSIKKVKSLDGSSKIIKLEPDDSQWQKYELMSKVGSGTYATVYKAVNKEDGKMYALKRIKLDTTGDEGIPFTVIREISLLKVLNHPNIVQLNEVINLPDIGMTLVFEYMAHDLKKYINKEVFLTGTQVKSFMYQLLKGLEYCHKKHVMHRDLKPQNLLIDKNGILKIADFGLARSNGIPPARLSSQVVTLWFRAPEVLLGSHKYSSAIDIWSVGCIFAEMVTLEPLFRGSDEVHQLKRIFKKLGTPNERKWKGIKDLPGWDPRAFRKYPGIPLTYLVPGLDEHGLDLMESMLRYDPSQRVTASQALNHPYFSSVELPSSIAQLYEEPAKS